MSAGSNRHGEPADWRTESSFGPPTPEAVLTLFEFSPSLLALVDADHRVRHGNPALERMLGWTAEELGSSPALSFVHPADRRAVMAALSGAGTSADGAVTFEVRTRCRDLSHRWISWTAGRAGGWTYAVGHDATVRRTEQQRAEHLAQIVDSSTDAVASVDPGATITSWNPAATRLFGYEEEEILGRSIEMLVLGDNASVATASLRRVLASGHAIARETRARHKDGAAIEVFLSAFPLRDESGGIVGASAIVRDITAERAARQRHAETESRYLKVLATTSEGVWRIDRHAVIDYVNPVFAAMLGRRVEELVGRALWEFVPEEAHAQAKRRLEQQRRSRRGTREEVRYLRGDGSTCWALMSTIPLFDEAGEHTGTLAMLTDITERRQAANERARLAAIVASSPEAIVGLTTTGIIESWNPGASELYGYTADQAIGGSMPALLAVDPAEPEWWVAGHARGSGVRYFETRDRHQDGHAIDVGVTGAPIRDGDGRIVGVARIARDLTENKRLIGDVQRFADHDPLTGLLNRKRLLEELERRLRYVSASGHRGALLLLDVDNFKLANDSYGLDTGDAMLRSIAEVLRSRMRHGDAIARLGGDDFAIVLARATTDDALQVAGDLRSLLCERPTGPPIMVSIGIALFGHGEQATADDVLTRAGLALFEAQEQGGDGARVYSGQTGGRTWARRIREALDADRLVLFGQPIIELPTGRTTHHELLVRMLADDGSLIPPGAFLPAAERFGLIRELDLWVIRRALGLAREGTPVSINLSAISIGSQDVLAELKTALGKGLDPSAVMLEVTETAAMTNITAARAFAVQLASLGIDLALDDFGTGFGSFTYLKHVPARYLKIDTDFVRGLSHNPQDQEIIRATVSIAHAFGMLTIAEGVEDAETLAQLTDFGIDRCQGYHLGRPGPMSGSIAPSV